MWGRGRRSPVTHARQMQEGFEEFVLDQLAELGEVACRPMFGAFGLYLGNTFAIYSGHMKWAGPYTSQASSTPVWIYHRDYPANHQMRLRENRHSLGYGSPGLGN